ncbi:hypothetical protein JM18_000606 [Phytophthora kernoviae]|uniref:CWH43-like N-terminal domain-containing protein n=2 Tax=Phytophthora kernoviae TaxID=325452 RepID=A0A8T0MC06_9STRA|nr:hypothetical protein G195_001476 [Phytophthora kernoviae 00238/432]KAG2532175.1 hypothetical protein JM16_000525 [Phytophthora kernoviae]KAG2533166.1 hypothetical protein JM18_000606 [Phytophthora kernoviae]
MQVSPYTIGARFAPVVATVVVIVTLVTCVTIAKVNDVYLGGLDWPYFSDTGRDSPGYSVFCAGLSIVAVSLVLTWLTNYQFQRELIEKESHENTDNMSTSTIRKYSEAVRVLGVLSTVGLPVLAFFSTTSYPDVHQYAAYWFFVLEAFALLLNTIASFKLTRLTEASYNPYFSTESEAQPQATNLFNPWKVAKASTKGTFYIQLVFTTLFLIAFLLYIPIGLAIVADFQRLTVEDVRPKTMHGPANLS